MYMDITSTVVLVLGGLLLLVAVLLGLTLRNLAELHYQLNLLLVRVNHRQSAARAEMTRAGYFPNPRRN